MTSSSPSFCCRSSASRQDSSNSARLNEATTAETRTSVEETLAAVAATQQVTAQLSPAPDDEDREQPRHGEKQLVAVIPAFPRISHKTPSEDERESGSRGGTADALHRRGPCHPLPSEAAPVMKAALQEVPEWDALLESDGSVRA